MPQAVGSWDEIIAKREDENTISFYASSEGTCWKAHFDRQANWHVADEKWIGTGRENYFMQEQDLWG